MDMSQEPFCVEIYRKMPKCFSGARILCGNLPEKTHMKMWREPFCVEILRKNAARPLPHLDQTLGLNTHRKNPFSVATLFGEIFFLRGARGPKEGKFKQ